ncbi:hypothetical protein KI387_031246, partial [Taxus chinensis]
MGDPMVFPAERTGRDENTWAMEGDGKEEMIVEVEGNDVGSDNGRGRRDDGSCGTLGESLTSTTSSTGVVEEMALETVALERDELPTTNEIFFGT